MSKRTAIKAYCRECAGGSYLEVIVCHLSDCPLWPYRTGLSAKGTSDSLKKALLRHPEVEKELASMGVDSPFSLSRDVKPSVFRGKSRRLTQTTGEGRPIRAIRPKAQGDGAEGGPGDPPTAPNIKGERRKK